MDRGNLVKIGDQWQLRFSRRLPHPPGKVWRALVEPEHLDAWFPTRIDGEREAGAKLHFVFTEGEAPPFDGEMLVYEPPSLLEIRWGDETLRFELTPDGDGTILRFLDTFADIGKAARDAAGWHVCLELLEHELSGETAPWRSRERWDEVHPRYVEQFPAEAATVGPAT